jgi:hypothetical protein
MRTIDVESARPANGRRASLEQGADPLVRRLADPVYDRAYRQWIDSLRNATAAKRRSSRRHLGLGRVRRSSHRSVRRAPADT